MNALPRDSYRWDWGLLALSAAFWLWLALACAPEWSANGNEAFGWILFPLAAYFLAKRLAATSPNAWHHPGRLVKWCAWAGLTFAVLCVLPVELARQAPVYWRIFLWAIYSLVVIVTISSALLTGGWNILRATVFPLLFLASVVPWPESFQQLLTLSLVLKITSLLGDILPLLGIPARIEGAMIVLPTCVVGVDEACSGIRSLQSAVMLGLAAGEWFQLRWPKRIAVLIWSLALAILLNVGRTLGLTIAGLRGGEAAISSVHDILGWAALLFLAGGIFLAGRLLSVQPENSIAPDPAPPFHQRFTGRTSAVAGALFAFAVSTFLAAHIWYIAHELHSPIQEPLLRVNHLPAIQVSSLPPSLELTLQATKGELVRLALPGEDPVHGYHLFWDASQRNSRQLYHQPEVCMPSGGWQPAGPEHHMEIDLNGLPISWRVAPYRRDGQLGLLLWTAWLDAIPMNFDRRLGTNIQSNILLQFIGNGRRRFTYEVAAIFVPYHDANEPIARSKIAVQSLFNAKP